MRASISARDMEAEAVAVGEASAASWSRASAYDSGIGTDVRIRNSHVHSMMRIDCVLHDLHKLAAEYSWCACLELRKCSTPVPAIGQY